MDLYEFRFLMFFVVAATIISGVKCGPVKNQSSLPHSLSPPVPVNCSEDATFCENVKDYPEDLIARAVGTEFREFFHKSGQAANPPHERDALVCGEEKFIVYPRAAKDEKHNWLYLVNTINYRQPVEVKKCKEGNLLYCKSQQSLPLEYTIECVNKTIKQKMVAIRNGQPSTDSFIFPNGCECHISEIQHSEQDLPKQASQ
ncbi:protein spaetzle 5-like [Tachypleus tridentatus]|uniref:protein spaetzle 5-like n=1 Tax=Tachypleus tridentatus TaxID=6853 RepID=UPI003FCF1789